MKRLIFLFSLIFIFSLNSFAQTNLVAVRIDRFEGGQNSYDLETTLETNESSVLVNTLIHRKGEISKRTGLALFAQDLGTTAFRGIGRYASSPDFDYMIVASGTYLLRSTYSGASWEVITSSLTADADTEFILANQFFFVLNGKESLTYWDGLNPIDINASPPIISSVGCWLKNYLFLRDDRHKDWVRFSHNLEPTLFDETDVFRVNTGDGQAIQRLIPFKLDELIIYKEKSLWLKDLSGTSVLTSSLQVISPDIGTVAPRSVASTGNDQWFLSNEPYAVRSLVRTDFDKITTNIVSRDIQDIFDGSGDTVLNKTYASKACAIFYDNKYFLAIPTGTSSVNDLVLVYDFLSGGWYQITGWYPAEWVEFNNNLYFIDALDGSVVQALNSTYYSDYASGPRVTSATPSTAITFQYETRRIDYGYPSNYKMPDALELECAATGNYNINVYLEIDEGGYQSVGSMGLRGNSAFLPVSLPFTLGSNAKARKTFHLQKFGEFKTIRLKFTQSGADEQCKLHSATLWSSIKPWRRE
ncbi:MAG: hypothetical protein FJ150_02700 [Euryarchaeota archaeon]|nr:hypothetical protein [Euryarchaeota archaeon]